MVKQDLILSMSEPTNRTIYAKKGDSGRLYDIFIADAEKENGTLRILQPDGSEVTAPAIIQAGGDAYKGDLVTFDALEEVPLTKAEVTLESSQDLHGQSNPYPAGGGKNLVDPNATIFTRYLRDAGNGSYYWTYSADSRSIAIPVSPSTAYTISRYLTNQAIYRISTIRVSTLPSVSDTTDIQSYQNVRETSASAFGTTRTITTDASATFLVIQFSGTTMLDFVQNGQVEKGSTATSYAPYSNICPIYPSNGKNLVNIGGSVFDTQQNPTTALPLASYSLIKGFAYTGYVRPNNITSFSASGTTITLTTTTSDYGVGLIAEVEVGKTYTFSATHDGYVVFAYYDASGFYVSHENKGTQGSYSATVPSGAKYLIVLIRGATAGTSNISIDKPQLELGSTATPYVPYQGINVYQRGYNLCPLPRSANAIKYNGSGLTTTDLDNGISVKGQNSGSFHAVGFLLFLADDYLGEKLTLSATMSGSNSSPQATLFLCDSAFGNRSSLGLLAQSGSVTVTVPSTASGKFIGLALASTTGADSESAVSTYTDIQLEEGETATPYQPYNGSTHPISLGRFVYGGKVDLVSGKLTIDRALVTLDGTQDLTANGTMAYGGLNVKFVPNPTKKNGATLNEGLMSDTFNAISENHLNPYYFEGRTTSGNLFFNMPSDVTTIPLAKTWFSNHPTQVSYLLAEPIEVDLTPTQISTLLGENNVWSSGEVEVAFEYDGLFAQLPEEATEQVGKCIGDVAFTGASSMPFILHILDDVQEETP